MIHSSFNFNTKKHQRYSKASQKLATQLFLHSYYLCQAEDTSLGMPEVTPQRFNNNRRRNKGFNPIKDGVYHLAICCNTVKGIKTIQNLLNDNIYENKIHIYQSKDIYKELSTRIASNLSQNNSFLNLHEGNDSLGTITKKYREVYRDVFRKVSQMFRPHSPDNREENIMIEVYAIYYQNAVQLNSTITWASDLDLTMKQRTISQLLVIDHYIPVSLTIVLDQMLTMTTIICFFRPYTRLIIRSSLSMSIGMVQVISNWYHLCI